jgi:hypothetical protein
MLNTLRIHLFIIFILHCLLVLPNLIFAQPTNTDIHNFMAFQDDQYVYLQWTIRSGRTCDGIRIMKADAQQGPYHEIGYIPGICGQVGSAETYNWTDSMPQQNSTTWYKLVPGGFADYMISYQFRNDQDASYAWYSEEGKYIGIRFLQLQTEALTLQVYTHAGSCLYTETSSSGVWHISQEKLSSGIYYYWILDTHSEIRTIGKTMYHK